MKINVITILLGLIVGIFMGCIKDVNTQSTNTNHEAVKNDTIGIDNMQTSTISMGEDGQPVKRTIEETIQDYDANLILSFCIAGNFTGSENKEILAFYVRAGRQYREGYTYVARVYCFICDTKGEEIVDVYELPYYGVTGFSSDNNLEKVPIEILPRDIHWLNNQWQRESA